MCFMLSDGGSSCGNFRHGSLFPRSDGCYSLAVPRVADQRSGVDFSLTEDGKQRNE